MEKLKIKACAPPGCGCPTLTIEENVDGIGVLYITDDFGGVVQMKISEFQILVDEWTRTGYGQ